MKLTGTVIATFCILWAASAFSDTATQQAIIQVTVGVKFFRDGDSITVTEVKATSPDLKTGDKVIVKGHYTLSSMQKASLFLSVTDTKGPGKMEIRPEQKIGITEGQGEFELSATLKYDGYLHVTFCSVAENKPFGELYFGTAKQMEEIKHWDLRSRYTSEYPPAAPSAPTPSTVSQPAVIKADAVNYSVRVQWKDAQETTNLLQVVTVEGDFKMNTAQRHSVKINNSDVPVIITLSGHLTVLSPEKGQLYLLLGKKEPFVTGTSVAGRTNAPVSSYQYCDMGLNSTVVVTFGKPLVIQTDENGEVSLLVKREEN